MEKIKATDFDLSYDGMYKITWNNNTFRVCF